MAKIVVLLSGGLDSSTLAYHLAAQREEVLPLFIHYGQRHIREVEGARAVSEALRAATSAEHDAAWPLAVPSQVLREVNLGALRQFLAGSSQTDARVPVPDGHYTDESMRATVVPNRNMVLLAVAGAVAVGAGAGAVAYAAHAGDHAIYPDCRPAFVEAMRGALALADYKPIELVAPFAMLSKTDIARRAIELGVPIDLTWSCYRGEAEHCGTCGTCVERIEALSGAGYRG